MSDRTDVVELDPTRRVNNDGGRPDRGELTMSDEDMRLVQVLVLEESAREDVTTVFEEDELDYVVSAGETDDTANVLAPMPAEMVEYVQRRLEQLDVHDDLYTVVIDTETVVSDRFDEEKPYRRVRGLGYQGISRSELHSAATDLMPDLSIYALLTAISAIVATAGVLLSSLPVLVGSMVIAPLIGPIMAASVATILDDDSLFRHTGVYQLSGLGIGLASAIGFASVVRFTSLMSPDFTINELLQISSHTAPNLLLIVVALAAGFSGALSLSTGSSVDLVGVMISAAIMPPIGVTGVAVAWAEPGVVVGSLAVVLVNLASVSLAAMVSLWYLGYHPESLTQLRKARSTMMVRSVVLLTAIILLAAVLAHVSGTEISVLGGLLEVSR